MKIKNKVIGIVLGVFASSIVFIASPISAHAGDCSPEDPCQTYAVIDSTGTVINVIVCQPSVCGSGTWDGLTVVPQVAADVNGKNRGGFYHDPESGKKVAVQNNVFTIYENNPVVQTSVETVEDAVTTVTTTTSNGASSSFTFESTVNAENIFLVPSENEFDQNTSASVKIDQTNGSSETETVRAEFEERTSLQAVEVALNAAAESEAQVQMVTKSISRISSMLRKWLRLTVLL